MKPLGYALLNLGVIVCLYGEVRFLVVAYKRNLWWFFGCLFVPLVSWIFFFLNLKATIRPFALSLLGLIVAVLGAWMAGVVWPK
jgi:FtsH-binding integral membrane protein